jgi:hypothetical protein
VSEVNSVRDEQDVAALQAAADAAGLKDIRLATASLRLAARAVSNRDVVVLTTDGFLELAKRAFVWARRPKS